MMTKFFLLGKPVIKALRGGLPRRLGRILFVAINIGFLQGCDHDAFDGIIYKPNGEIISRYFHYFFYRKWRL